MKGGMWSEVTPLVSELLKRDTRDLPHGLTVNGTYRPPTQPIPFARYYAPTFARLEQERLWKRTWQYACREEDIPQAGDRITYDVGDNISYIVVNGGDGRYRAFNNACLHRGTRLTNGQAGGRYIRCPFHGWEWNANGKLRAIPSAWDFPGVDVDAYSLPEVRVETWDGFIFINPDPDAPPLAAALGILPALYRGKGRANNDRYTVAHAHKKVRANWKICMEIFFESYHVLEVHADVLLISGDAATQYDIWESEHSHISRLITPIGTPSPHLGNSASALESVKAFAGMLAMGMPGAALPQFEESKGNLRGQLAAWQREQLGLMTGCDLTDISDTELLDSIEYYMFPNFMPWFGNGLPLIYRFLPYGSDPDESIMEIRLTAPLPANGKRPPKPKLNHLGFDDFFCDKAPEFGMLSHVFDQDMANLPNIQKGLKGAHATSSFSTLATYQESRIQHFHNVLSKVVGQDSFA